MAAVFHSGMYRESMCKVSDLSPWTFCSNEHTQLFIFGQYTLDNSYELKDDGIAILSISAHAGKRVYISLFSKKEERRREGHRNRGLEIHSLLIT